MMDPVSVFAIVSAAGNLAFKSGKVVQTLYELAEKYKQAEVTILSIIQECRTIELAWTRIERWAENGLDDYHDYEQLAERLQLSLYSGQLVMNELEKDLAALQTSPQFSKFRRKAKIVWNDRLLQDHQNRIRGQVCAMLLLLEVIQLPSRSDRAELLSIKEPVFRSVDDSVRSIVPTRQSIYSNDAASIKSSVSYDITYIPFSFENQLFTSDVYKRNFRPRIKDLRQKVKFGRSSHARKSASAAGDTSSLHGSVRSERRAYEGGSSHAETPEKRLSVAIDTEPKVATHSSNASIEQSAMSPSSIAQSRMPPSSADTDGRTAPLEFDWRLDLGLDDISRNDPNQGDVSLPLDLQAPSSSCSSASFVSEVFEVCNTSDSNLDDIWSLTPYFHSQKEIGFWCEYVEGDADPFQLRSRYQTGTRVFTTSGTQVILSRLLAKDSLQFSILMQTFALAYGAEIVSKLVEKFKVQKGRVTEIKDTAAPRNGVTKLHWTSQIRKDPQISLAAAYRTEAASSGMLDYCPTALQLACASGNPAVVKFLLSIGAPSLTLHWSTHPFILATKRRHKYILELLLHLGDATVSGTIKNLALVMVVNEDCALSDKWLDPNQNDRKRCGKDVDIVTFLLSNGANPNARDKKGVSVLSIAIKAAYSGHKHSLQIVDILLRKGAKLCEEEQRLVQLSPWQQFGQQIEPILRRHRLLTAGWDNVHPIDGLPASELQSPANVSLTSVESRPVMVMESLSAREETQINSIPSLPPLRWDDEGGFWTR